MTSSGKNGLNIRTNASPIARTLLNVNDLVFKISLDPPANKCTVTHMTDIVSTDVKLQQQQQTQKNKQTKHLLR